MNVFTLQLFLLVIGVPLFFLAALVEERTRAETSLRASEMRFRAAFESAATGMMLVDPTGHILQVNRPVTTMLGYTQTELRARTFMDLTYPNDLEPNLLLLRRALAGEVDSYQLEKRFIHKAGHPVWGLVSAGVVRDVGGKPLYLVGQLEDITERKRLARELAEQAERLERVFEGIGDGVFVYDKEGHFLRTNAAARHLLSLDAAPANFYQLMGHEQVVLYAPLDDQGSPITPDDWLVTRALRGEEVRGDGRT